MHFGIVEGVCNLCATCRPVLWLSNTFSTAEHCQLILRCAVDEMGSRLDDLEKSISDLVQQAGVDAGVAPAGSSPEKA